MSTGWTPIALSRDVPAGTTRGVIIDGELLAGGNGNAGEFSGMFDAGESEVARPCNI